MSRLVWQKATMAKKMREQGHAPHEDLRPRAPSGVKLTKKGNAIVKVEPSRKRKTQPTIKKKTVRVVEPKANAAHFVAIVVTAHLRGQPLPKRFRKMSPAQQQVVASYPTTLAWAQAQPGFQEELQRQTSRLQPAALAPPPSSSSSDPTNTSEGVLARIAALVREVEDAKARIAKIEAEIKQLVEDSFLKSR